MSEKKKNSKYAKLAYHHLISNTSYILIIIVSVYISRYSLDDIKSIYSVTYSRYQTQSILLAVTVVLFMSLYFMTRPKPVYLLDFSCYKPKDSNKCSREIFVNHSRLANIFTEENLLFQKKVLERSGLGQDTYFPDSVLRLSANPCMAEARKEAEMVLFGSIDDLLAKTRVKVKYIGILIMNSSCFNPTPSLSAMIVNHYKMRESVKSYNLGGMGCSVGMIAVDLAKQLLQVVMLLECSVLLSLPLLTILFLYSTLLSVPLLLIKWGEPWSYLQPTTDIDGSLLLNHRKIDRRWWRAQAVRYLMRFQTNYTCYLLNVAKHTSFGMQAAAMAIRNLPAKWPQVGFNKYRSRDIEKFVWSSHKPWIPRPLLSMHVRMGDKSCEMKVVGFESYMQFADRIRNNFPNLRNIWLSTEMQWRQLQI